ncbi:MAG: hypothetical protein UT11_C0009G0008 [Berkelbacteria bacterium GW2011_GWA2_38_9]|uniref:Uncharacterized protein n=1 Tax=Berkelbacteria bacterium GW2011_GWA2_38_9 TaxID=1618334 RepID=A0A0G0LQQ0_9BACT|nr:MAG: hypothetical protein UT11_C0009G0008 [Berkelbacteria bacterium GW2011_GWA2_38_9]
MDSFQTDYVANQNGSSSSLVVVIILILLIAIVIVLAWLYIRKKSLVDFIRSNNLVVLKVIMPREQKGAEDEKKDFRELLSVVEPFLASLSHIYQKPKIISFGQEIISLEILAKNREIFFYVAAPKNYAIMVEKQIHGQYPAAHIEISKDDYKLFPHDGQYAVDAASLDLRRSFIYPIRTYKELELDPLNAITNSLSKLGDDNAAAIQIILRPTGEWWQKKINNYMRQIQSGHDPVSGKNPMLRTVGRALSSVQGSEKEMDRLEQRDTRLTPMQEDQLKQMGEKSKEVGFETKVRIITVAPENTTAKMNLNNILSAFAQFNAPESNGFRIGMKKSVNQIVGDYILRRFGYGSNLLLNVTEIASIYHFPNRNIDTPGIRWMTARNMPPPSNLPKEGTIVGESIYRGEAKPIRLLPQDRRRHLYMIGKTGVGKTVLFENLILQDIQEGKGVCYIDPNGDAIEFILERIPTERAQDVILFNPADVERPIGLNLLDWKRPEDKDFLVQEAVAMFYKLFDPGGTGIVGPQFEHWMRNAALTLMSEPQGGTLIEIPRIFTDKEFENEMVAKVTDPVVKSFWTQQMAKTSDYHKSEMLNYFVSKFGRFMTNDMMRNIIGQKASAFDFRDIMDNKKILLVNLSKGLIGDINAQLLGMIIVTKLQVAAFSRQNIKEEERVPFYLYVDEFQNFTTDAFATILSEARKYALVLNITNQYIAQLPENIRDAVIGNAGTMISWRVGAGDAEFLTKEFDPLTVDDMVNIDKYNFYIKMLIDNTPTRPFNAKGIAPSVEKNPVLAEAIRKLSRLSYGRDRAIVDMEIKQRTKLDSIEMPGLNQGVASSEA